jgi:hypothetical protein
VCLGEAGLLVAEARVDELEEDEEEETEDVEEEEQVTKFGKK